MDPTAKELPALLTEFAQVSAQSNAGEGHLEGPASKIAELAMGLWCPTPSSRSRDSADLNSDQLIQLCGCAAEQFNPVSGISSFIGKIDSGIGVSWLNRFIVRQGQIHQDALTAHHGDAEWMNTLRASNGLRQAGLI